EDSGPGFDYANQLSRGLPAHTALSGRGIRLVAELCESLEFRDSGNRVEALFSWVNS
ncbi:MAG: ATP-binding protein, partial [Gammaproteobacteria bacterium]|nr:ATP-binding protein [Gammaproteobacteria bacterium]